MPPNTVYVGRPTKWGNPYKINEGYTHSRAVDLFRVWITEPQQRYLRDRAKNILRGKNLSCFCPINQPCHADVLLEIANAEQPQSVVMAGQGPGIERTTELKPVENKESIGR